VNPQDPLANLHPLREPTLIGWWPPAPGWWLLGGIAVLCLLAMLWFCMRRYRANAYRRQALAQLQRMRDAYERDQDASQYSAGLNALLKSVALRAYPQRAIAASSGKQWLQFLNSQVSKTELFGPDFVTAAYRRDCPDMDMEQLHLAVRTWIRRHEVTQ